MKDGRMILQNASPSILLFIYVIYYSERYRFSFKKFVILISIPFRVFKTSQKKCSYNSPYVPTFVSHRAKKFVFSIACSLLTTNVQQYLYGPQMRTYIKGYVNIKLKSELFLSQTFNAKSCCNIVLCKYSIYKYRYISIDILVYKYLAFKAISVHIYP